jgi:hypothetical protein
MPAYEMVAWNGQNWYRIDTNVAIGSDTGNMIIAWGQSGWEMATSLEYNGTPMIVFMRDSGLRVNYLLASWNGQNWVQYGTNQILATGDLATLLNTASQQGWKLAAVVQFGNQSPLIVFQHP